MKLSSKSRWIASRAIYVTACSLIAAAITGNPNWPWNIPLGLVVGGAWGWLSWKIREHLMKRALMKLTNEFTYTRRNPSVQAVWWNGDNRDEVIRFFRDCGLPEGQGPYFADEDDEDGYNMVQCYWTDDHEFDVKTWILFVAEEDMYHSWTPSYFSEVFDAKLMS